jgi:hypothetical protein
MKGRVETMCAEIIALKKFRLKGKTGQIAVGLRNDTGTLASCAALHIGL